jgi:hypothetical protein
MLTIRATWEYAFALVDRLPRPRSGWTWCVLWRTDDALTIFQTPYAPIGQ